MHWFVCLPSLRQGSVARCAAVDVKIHVSMACGDLLELWIHLGTLFAAISKVLMEVYGGHDEEYSEYLKRHGRSICVIQSEFLQRCLDKWGRRRLRPRWS
jgi:hypothetical protein